MLDYFKSFLKQPTYEEQMRKWQRNLRTEIRQLDRQIRDIKMTEAKVERELKAAGKMKKIDLCQTLARELVNSKRACTRISTAQVQLNSLSMQLNNHYAQSKVIGEVKKCTRIMKLSSKIHLPQLNQTMANFHVEMIRAGIIDELVDDSIDDAFDEIDEDIDVQVSKVIFELTDGAISELDLIPVPQQIPTPPTTSIPILPTKTVELSADSPNISEINKRLNALRE